MMIDSNKRQVAGANFDFQVRSTQSIRGSSVYRVEICIQVIDSAEPTLRERE
jgi:hypothetical protein